MGWLAYAILASLLFGTYNIFATKANVAHGENVTMLFESAVWIIPIATILIAARSDFQKVTLASATYATLMGVAEASGFYLMLVALRKEPGKMTTITLVIALYWIATLAYSEIIMRVKPGWIPEAIPATPKQWVAVGLVLAGVILFNLR
ncbi:MAG: hypothetical protein ABSC29_02615 [Minisyncoccia bacterium]|jgi:uncharacterized membrane protein